MSTPEPEKSSESDSESDESNEGLAQPKPLATKEHPLARPYTELGDGQVTEILSKHLELFQTASRMNKMRDCEDIVLHREAMEHCARLYRAVVRIKPYLILHVITYYIIIVRVCQERMLCCWDCQEVANDCSSNLLHTYYKPV